MIALLFIMLSCLKRNAAVSSCCGFETCELVVFLLLLFLPLFVLVAAGPGDGVDAAAGAV